MDTASDLVEIRRRKLEDLRALGVDPYGTAFPDATPPGQLRATFEEGRSVRVAGRIVSQRIMGKSVFGDLADATGRIQFYFNTKDAPPDQVAAFKLLDLGDIIGIDGETFVTRTGEPTVKIGALTVLAKSLRPMPDKWHGLADVERRYRQRYLDLLSNPKAASSFVLRSRIVREIRNFLDARGFVEVETPMMQSVPGGAAARPFVTRHNALGIDLFLRIAPELYLKRLLVGGFQKIFELNRNFRNEGVSRRHNPEFTMLEAYQLGADYETMAALVEEMICHLARTFLGTLTIEESREETETATSSSDADGESVSGRTIDLTPPWRRARYRDLIREIDAQWFERTPAERRKRAIELGVEIAPGLADFEVTQQIFEKLVEEKTMNPLFVTHLPVELVPLAKQNSEDRTVVDVYELIIGGMEVSPGYSELNDPQIQRRRLEEQAGEETQKIDEDFLLALEYGMPPAGGIGIGIDRLAMLLTGAESLRDVILFPQMKPRERGHGGNAETDSGTESAGGASE